MPISPQSDDSGGFTLIEMLVVLAILSIVAIIVGPRLDAAPSGLRRQQAAAELSANIRREVQLARMTGLERSITPSAIVDDAELLPTLTSERRDTLILYPDGSTSGGRIDLNGRPLLLVDWLTGAVSHAR